MRRFLSVWLTDWPLDRLRRMRSRGSSARPVESPFALTERAAKGLRIVAATAGARAMGVAPGLTLADARARAPGLRSEEIDRAADAAALRRLARWATRWSPIVALDGRDGLMLDVTGCAHLWGGEGGMLADVSARLACAGLAHRLGLGPTPGAAWALAHAAPGQVTALEGTAEAATEVGLAELPVAGLRLSEETLALLRRFGLTRIGQLSGIDRAALARRFRSGEVADRVMVRLDQAFGRIAEPLRPVGLPETHGARLPCPEPLLDRAGIEAGLSRLLEDLCARLEAAGLGARRVLLQAYRADGTHAALAIGAARPSREPTHLARLLAERLDRLDPGYGIDLLRLTALRTGPLEEATPPLGAAAGLAGQGGAALAALADRIAARLGEDWVAVLEPVASHQPERAERRVPFEGALPAWTGTGTIGSAAPAGPRPLRRLARPEPVEVLAEVPDGPPVRFIWRRVTRRVVRADGPERIAPDWWRPEPGLAEGAPRARDYYRVEDGEGRRYWIFREGLYGDGRGAPPRWLLHGLFA